MEQARRFVIWAVDKELSELGLFFCGSLTAFATVYSGSEKRLFVFSYQTF
jgi:hypothetical protein